MSKEAQKEQCCYGGIAHDCHAGVGCRIAERLTATPQQPAQQDIPDLIAGALGVSRGTAYDMMRGALAEQPAQQEPVFWFDPADLAVLRAAVFDTVPQSQRGGWKPLYTTPQAQPHMTTNLHDKMLKAIDAYFSASNEIEAHIAEEQLLDVRDEINKYKLAEQPAQPLEPVQCWKCGDMDPAFYSKCDVPACGMKEGKTP